MILVALFGAVFIYGIWAIGGSDAANGQSNKARAEIEAAKARVEIAQTATPAEVRWQATQAVILQTVVPLQMTTTAQAYIVLADEARQQQTAYDQAVARQVQADNVKRNSLIAWFESALGIAVLSITSMLSVWVLAVVAVKFTARTKTENNAAKVELSKVQEQLVAVSKQLRDDTAHAKSAQQTLASLGTAINLQRNENGRLANLISQHKRDLQAQRTAMEKTIVMLQSEVEAKRATLDGIKNDIAAKEQELKALSSQADVHRQEAQNQWSMIVPTKIEFPRNGDSNTCAN
jgi:hypothetical protein